MPRTYDDDLKTMLALGHEAIGVLFLINTLQNKLGRPVTNDKLQEFGCPSDKTLAPILSKLTGFGLIERIATPRAEGWIVPQAQQLLLGQIMYGVQPQTELPNPHSSSSDEVQNGNSALSLFTYVEPRHDREERELSTGQPHLSTTESEIPTRLESLESRSRSSLINSFKKELTSTSHSDSRLPHGNSDSTNSADVIAQNRALLNALDIKDKNGIETISHLPHINPRYIAATFAEYEDERIELEQLPPEKRGKRYVNIGAFLWRLNHPDRYEPKSFPPKQFFELDELIEWATNDRTRKYGAWEEDDDE